MNLINVIGIARQKPKLLFWILSIIFALSHVSCTSPLEKDNASFELTFEEQAWLTQFFNDILFFENGIYTLWGSKPMTLIAIPQYTEAQIQEYYNSLSEEEKQDTMVIEGYSLPETWEKWKSISKRFPMKKYMLFESDLLQESDTTFVFFVDILKTAMVIQDNYQTFRNIVGFDFHPLEVILEINQKDSKFWNQMNALLWGLLFGYGKTNAYAFQWKHFDHPEACNDLCENLEAFSSNKPKRGVVKYSIDNFEIPSFASFNEEFDETIEKYKSEKALIQATYKGHDFLELTLKKLMN